MERRQEIIYMQVRIARIASERWRLSPRETAHVFETYRVAEYIEQNYELLHLEGDEAVFQDISAFLEAKGANPLAKPL